MKRTVNINLGGVPFIIDEDAYEILKNYLEDVSSRIGGDDEEVIGDIENRIAEIFSANLSLRTQVVDAAVVNRAISVIGRPSEFGERRNENQQQSNTQNNNNMGTNNNTHKLYRDMDNKVIGGVCSGVADYMNVDPTLVRVITLLLTFLGGLSLWVYIIMWIVIPRSPEVSDNFQNNSR